jgi:hypothetical protein
VNLFATGPAGGVVTSPVGASLNTFPIMLAIGIPLGLAIATNLVAIARSSPSVPR